MKYLPAEDVPDAHHWLILHGRYVCKARNPQCATCEISDLCRKHERDLKQAVSAADRN